MNITAAYLCIGCGEVYVPPTTPLARRTCPSCDGAHISPLSGLLSRWCPPWQRLEHTP